MNDDEKDISVVFEIGKAIEQSQEVFESEQKDLAAMKNAFAMSVKCLEDYRAAMLREMQAAQLSIKDAEYGKTYVTRCIEIIANLCLETEKKLLRAEGGTLALKQAVLSIKEIYDREKSKVPEIDQIIEPNKVDWPRGGFIPSSFDLWPRYGDDLQNDLKNNLLDAVENSSEEYKKAVEEAKPLLEALEQSKVYPRTRNIPPIVRPRRSSTSKKR